MPYTFLIMPLVVTKSRVHYRKRYHRTRLLTITVLDCWIFCKTVDVAIVNGRAGSDASIGKCACKNVSVVDYALVLSDLFPLIRGFAVLDFCELYSDVHCPIILKLNLTEAQETELGHFESDDDDCLEDADERNLQFITGKPVWCKTREDEYIFALDDAVIN